LGQECVEGTNEFGSWSYVPLLPCPSWTLGFVWVNLLVEREERGGEERRGEGRRGRKK
jgi:hypothetical protein